MAIFRDGVVRKDTLFLWESIKNGVLESVIQKECEGAWEERKAHKIKKSRS